jgi:hypothetical protein
MNRTFKLVAALLVVGAVGYFTLTRKSTPITQQTPTPTATSTQTKAAASLVPTPKGETTGQFEGLLKGSDNSWSLMSFGKVAVLNPLQFNSNSICVIGPDEGPCSVLQSNFNKGGSNLGGGDNVSVDGDKQGSTITVKRLTLKDNFVMNGYLVEDSSSGQKAWSLAFQPPVGNSTIQDPNRPTSTIPLKFDEKSGCGDLGEERCDTYKLHQNDLIFVRGIKYKGVLIVRLLTVPATPPISPP